MRLRNGFVSNSSSCSFIFVLPKHRELLSTKSTFEEYFGLKSIYDHEIEDLRDAVWTLYNEEHSIMDSNYRLLIEYLGKLSSEEGWIKNRAEDPRDFCYTLEDYKRYANDLKQLLFLLKTRGEDLLFMEVGDSCEYQHDSYIKNSLLVEDLSHEERAKKMITENCFIFNNR